MTNTARILLLVLSSAGIILFPNKTLAQNVLNEQRGTGVATSLNLRNVKQGMIICSGEGEYVPCQTGFSPNMVGVVTLKPAISFKTDNPDATSVLNSGKTEILVNTKGGEIKRGDFITSSSEDGVGQKAAKSGYVVGTALEDAPPPDENGHSLVRASIDIRPIVLSSSVGRNLVQLIREGVDATFLSPLSALRYVLAGFIAAFSIIIGLLFFGRVARSGIWAMSRNPSAGRSIQLSILFNVILTLIVMGTGVLIAYVVIAI